MALQGATLATGTSHLAPTRPTSSSKGRGANLLSQLNCVLGLRLSAGRHALNSAFANGGVSLLALTDAAAPPRLTMRLASKQAYICRDCGYIYNDRTPFEKLLIVSSALVSLLITLKKFCGAPKRRFRPYDQPVTRNANDTSVRKFRKEELKKEEDAGYALPVAIVIGAVGLVALYFYLNSQF